MKRIILVVVTILFCLSSPAQEAQVILLDPADGEKAARAYEAMIAAEIDYQLARDAIAEKYLIVPRTDLDAATGFWYYKDVKFGIWSDWDHARVWRRGWEKNARDWQFDKNFKYIVPAAPAK